MVAIHVVNHMQVLHQLELRYPAHFNACSIEGSVLRVTPDRRSLNVTFGLASAATSVNVNKKIAIKFWYTMRTTVRTRFYKP
jgi:hypothetical protein